MAEPTPLRRRWLLLAGGALLGLAGLVGLLLLPPVQAWLLRRAVASQTGWRVDFTRFAAGAGGLESEGLVFSMPGLEARAEPLAVRVAPLALLQRRELRIEEIAARRLQLTLVPARLDAGSTTPAPPFTGLLPLLRSPLAWSLQRTAVDGRVDVQDDNQALVAGEFRVDGGGLAADRPGEFAFAFSADSVLLPPGPDAKIRSEGTLRLAQDDAHGVAHIHLTGSLSLPAYAGHKLPAATYALTVQPAPGGEHYTGTLRLADGDIALDARLDAATAELTGTLRFTGGADLFRALLGAEAPALAAHGEIRFRADLGRGDVDADVTADFSGRDWSRHLAELSAVDALGGRLTARLERRAGALRVESLAVEARGESSPASLSLTLAEPLPLPAWPDRPLARLTLAHWPAAWANPFLREAGLTLAGATFEGEWLLHAPPALDHLRLQPARPATLANLQIASPDLPALPPVSLAFRPTLTLRLADADLVTQVDDFVLTAPGGDRLAGEFAIGLPADSTTHLRGSLAGTLPTLLTGPDRPLPFRLETAWDATLSADGNRLDARRLDLRLFEGNAPQPAFTCRLLQPVQAGSGLPAPGTASPDLLQLRLGRLGLDWLSRWLPAGWLVGGNTEAGEGFVRQEADGAYALRTVTPWSLRNFSLGLGGREVFRGRATLEAGATLTPQQARVQVTALTLADERGNRITGTAAATVGLADHQLGGELHLQADLPALPHSPDTFGPLQARLDLKAARFQGNLFMTEQAALSVTHRGGDLLRLDSPEPFLLGFNDRGVYATATLAPLTLRTGEIPLAWLRPWLPPGDLAGVIEPAEFLLAANIQQYHLRPTRPLRVRGLSLGPPDAPRLRDASLAIYPGLDAELHLVLLPEFAFAYVARLHGTDGAATLGEQRVADLDAALEVLGNDRTVLPKAVDLTLHADFGALTTLPGHAASGLPARGQITLRANGDLLGDDPLELWTRLEGVPARDGRRLLAPLELTAHGKVHAKQTPASADFDVALALDDPARPTDAAFRLTVKPGETLDLASTFRSSRIDLTELLAWQEAFTPAAVAGADPYPSARPAAASAAPAARRSGQPAFWSVLRGHLDLEIGTAEFAPYRIDDLRGRLELGAEELALTGLAGRMFAGEWSGRVGIRHEPGAPDGGHALAADFAIRQFESARVVQTVLAGDFPSDYAKIDARFDVQASFRSRGDSLGELIERAHGGFTAASRGGTVRLTLPKQEMASSLAILGGTVALSPELRALGRLLRKFAEMPVDELTLRGARDESGEVRLEEFRLVSPQARLTGRGRIAPAGTEPLMNRPLEAAFQLAARDETAVILGRMGLLGKTPDAAGYLAMREPFTVGGRPAEPDTRALYDLLARAVAGSKGTWGFLMRRVEAELAKTRPRTTAGP